MQSGLMGLFASVDLLFYYLFHEFALIPTFLMIGLWGGRDRRSIALEITIYLTLGALISLGGLVALNVMLDAPNLIFQALPRHYWLMVSVSVHRKRFSGYFSSVLVY